MEFTSITTYLLFTISSFPIAYYYFNFCLILSHNFCPFYWYYFFSLRVLDIYLKSLSDSIILLSSQVNSCLIISLFCFLSSVTFDFLMCFGVLLRGSCKEGGLSLPSYPHTCTVFQLGCVWPRVRGRPTHTGETMWDLSFTLAVQRIGGPGFIALSSNVRIPGQFIFFSSCKRLSQLQASCHCTTAHQVRWEICFI